MSRFEPRNAYYIKLGQGGEWEKECINEKIIRFGYNETPEEFADNGDWEAVRRFWVAERENSGTGTRDTNQIRIFYESTEKDIFITFSDGTLRWCRPSGVVSRRSDRSHWRPTVDGWHKTSIGGQLLTSDRLSGNLLKVQMYRGTICEVQEFAYLVRKLNDELLPEVQDATNAKGALQAALAPLMRLLTWQDFELLVELVFAASGWRRVGRTGGVEKTIDLDLILPSTRERAFVQIKSQADFSTLDKYVQELTDAYNKMFFVWHSGLELQEHSNPKVRLVNAERLAEMILDAGLVSWLINKTS